MNEFFEWLSQNSAATITLIVAFGGVVAAITLMFLVAFFQGREISLWPLKIGPQLDKPKSKELDRGDSEGCNTFTEKKIIDDVWQQLIDGASESVEVFGGDVSWAQRDKVKITNIIKNGVRFAVLCHNPYQNAALQANIYALLETGAEVKFFDKNKYVPPYGLLIDGGSSTLCTAFRVNKNPKLKIDNKQEGLESTDIYDYLAI